MLSLKAYYDGNAFVPLKKMNFRKNQEAVLVVDENDKPSNKEFFEPPKADKNNFIDCIGKINIDSSYIEQIRNESLT